MADGLEFKKLICPKFGDCERYSATDWYVKQKSKKWGKRAMERGALLTDHSFIEYYFSAIE
jgi:hypothetical protein